MILPEHRIFSRLFKCALYTYSGRRGKKWSWSGSIRDGGSLSPDRLECQSPKHQCAGCPRPVPFRRRRQARSGHRNRLPHSPSGRGAQPVTNYDQEYIQKTGYQTVTDVLKDLPAAVRNFLPAVTAVISFSPGSASIGLQGFPPN
jgi:hypothetical protein